ncbi:hypothetical protein [Tahibacter harae]|uniref:Ig-like domain-containing protein n=1 Tax=Tahibacter harae TaxID=2963937 RepID=A0ABT1QMT3_9GAMM|nr:hypothetical protein [Tahibacter harae]MCQ4163340.1 hypothetical protein [Tahibacter harae]
MRQFRPTRTTVLLGLALAGATGVSQAAADFSLRFQDEDAPKLTAMVVDRDITSGVTLTTVGLDRPMLCANLTATAQGTRLATVLPGFTPSNGDFKFGQLDTTVASRPPLSLSGVKGWRYTSVGLDLEPFTDTLACYVLSADGVRKQSAHLFDDTFASEATGPNASLVTRVVALPDGESNYKYFIDVNIPAEFAGRNYVVTDGFDSSVFSSDLSQYCAPTSPSATVCSGLTITQNNVNFRGTVPAEGVTKRFIVIRPLKSGVFSLPANPDAMLTTAALFIAPSASGPEDRDLSDNVSVGRALLSDLDPVITAPSIPNMAEGTGATGLSFVLTDDTSENGLPPLSATVSVNFNGNVVQTNATCLVGTPQGGEVTRRNCTFDIPVFDQHFATDAVAGTYAPNVSASVTIVATDGRNQTSTRVVPFHVVGSENDPPTFSLSKALEDPSASNGNLPTLRCEVQPSGVRNQTPQCQGLIEGFVLDRKPGPTYAYDELKTQGTFFAGVDTNNKLQCSGSSPSIFSFSGANSPKFVYNGDRVDLSYSLTGATGYSDCWVVVGDNNYPAGHSYTQSQIQFRILVAPPPAP